MDREDIIRLAREVGYPLVEYEGTPYIPPLLATLLETVAAAQRPWIGLTDEEIKEIVGPYGDTPIKGYTRKLFDQIEDKLREKNI